MKISRQLRTDRKAKTVIKADVHKTKVILTIDKLQLSLSKVETQRVCDTLAKSLAIQESNKADSKPLPSFNSRNIYLTGDSAFSVRDIWIAMAQFPE